MKFLIINLLITDKFKVYLVLLFLKNQHLVKVVNISFGFSLFSFVFIINLYKGCNGYTNNKKCNRIITFVTVTSHIIM